MKKGFTLIEVLLTVAILAVGVITIHQAFSRCIEGIRRSEERVLASMILKKAAVDFELSAWTSFAAIGLYSPSLETGYPGYSVKGASSGTGVILTVTAPSKIQTQASFVLNSHAARTLKES